MFEKQNNNKYIRTIFHDAINIHIKAFFKTMTIKKLFNFFLIHWEIILKKTNLRGKPYTLTLDSTNICNLKCKYCSTGRGHTFGRIKKIMSFEEFRHIFDQFQEYIFILNLYLWGEPFLNKDIFKMIKYAKKNNVFVSISTNFNIQIEQIDKIIDSKIDHLLIGLDGYNQKTYSSYRKGGDFDKVITNIKKISDIKKKKKLKYPILQAQYLVFKDNEKEINKFIKFAKKLNVDQIDLLQGSWTRRNNISKLKFLQKRDHLKRKHCIYPWVKALVASDGGFNVCCYKPYKEQDLGNLLTANFETIWNSKKLIEIRKSNRNIITQCTNCKRLKS